MQSTDEKGCSDGSGPAEEADGVVRLRPGLRAGQLRTALSKVGERYKVSGVAVLLGCLYPQCSHDC